MCYMISWGIRRKHCLDFYLKSKKENKIYKYVINTLTYILIIHVNTYFFQVLVAQSCPTLCDCMDCSLPGSSVRGILQARMLEWVAIPFSRGSSRPLYTNAHILREYLLKNLLMGCREEIPRHPRISTLHYSIVMEINCIQLHGIIMMSLSCPFSLMEACYQLLGCEQKSYVCLSGFWP